MANSVPSTHKEYAEAAAIVEDLVRIKSRKYAKRHYGPDDIAQEIRVKCWTALHTFDPEKGQSLKTYLNVVTENSLRNLMRDKFATFNPPCKKRCDHYDVAGKPTKDAIKCSTYRQYIANYKRKCGVRMPASVDSAFKSAAEGMVCDRDYLGELDLDMSIRTALRLAHHALEAYYDDMLRGAKVPRKIKIQIQGIVRGIL